MIVLVVIVNIAGGTNPKRLAQQSYELTQQTLSAGGNLQRITRLARRAEAIEEKVKKLSVRNREIYDEELAMLIIGGTGSTGRSGGSTR